MRGEAVKLMVLFLGNLSIRDRTVAERGVHNPTRTQKILHPKPQALNPIPQTLSPLNLNRLEGEAQQTPRASLAAAAQPLDLAVLSHLSILFIHVSIVCVCALNFFWGCVGVAGGVG